MEAIIEQIPGDKTLQDATYAYGDRMVEITETMILAGFGDIATTGLYCSKSYINDGSTANTGAATNKKEWKTFEAREVAKTQSPAKIDVGAKQLLVAISHLAVDDAEFLELLTECSTTEECAILESESDSVFIQDHEYAEKFRGITNDETVITAILCFFRKFIKVEIFKIIQGIKVSTTSIASSTIRATLFSKCTGETASKYSGIIKRFEDAVANIKKPIQPKATRVGAAAEASHSSPLVSSFSNLQMKKAAANGVKRTSNMK